ncbi:MAG: ferrous iron transport protein A [Propionibacteriaceae bacterium]|jgi:Fe2+ transport system protein FeoA|nr:ferrous iron transport protein A [Propionibacteriaceae bacterium]
MGEVSLTGVPQPNQVLNLSSAPTGTPLTVLSTPADPDVSARLLALGWRLGAQIAVVRRSGGGARVIELSGARVAIGGPLARHLAVKVVA